jgi:hypothetical protein
MSLIILITGIPQQPDTKGEEETIKRKECCLSNRVYEHPHEDIESSVNDSLDQRHPPESDVTAPPGATTSTKGS